MNQLIMHFLLIYFQELTTLPPVTGSPRGWTVPVSVEEQLLEKVDIPDREINETVANQAIKDGDKITSVRIVNFI